MWIRSQNKGDIIGELIPITHKLSIVWKHDRATLEDKYLICHKEDILGTYKSKERAIEVLDEIQCFLENNYESDMPQHTNSLYPSYIVCKTYKTVYQMPNE